MPVNKAVRIEGLGYLQSALDDTRAQIGQTLEKAVHEAARETAGMPKKKRGYTYDYTPTGAHHRYLLDKIPAALWRKVRAKCKREGVSLRAQLLKMLTDWTQK